MRMVLGGVLAGPLSERGFGSLTALLLVSFGGAEIPTGLPIGFPYSSTGEVLFGSRPCEEFLDDGQSLAVGRCLEGLGEVRARSLGGRRRREPASRFETSPSASGFRW